MEDLNELRKIAETATPGPWQWGPETPHWGDCGPNLETVERGPLYEDGSQGAAAEVVGSWGHDANGISVEDHDKAFISTFDPPTVLALITELETLRRRFDAMRRQRDGYRNQLRKTEQQVQTMRAELEAIQEQHVPNVRSSMLSPHHQERRRVMQVIESATGARVLPFMGDQNATVSEWAAHTVFDADLRTKSSVHRQLASNLHIQGENNE